MTDMHLPSYVHFIDSHDLFQILILTNNMKAVSIIEKQYSYNFITRNFCRSLLWMNYLATGAKSSESASLCGYVEEGNYLILIQSLKSLQI